MVADRKAKRIMKHPITLSPWILDGLELSRREAEVLYQVACGKTNTEIGCILGVSPRTVQKHLEHIYHKLGVRTRTAAVLRVLALTWYWSRHQPRDGPYRKPSMARLEEVSFDGQAPAQRSRAAGLFSPPYWAHLAAPGRKEVKQQK